MTIHQTPTFARAAKKLSARDKAELDVAIHTIMADPAIAEAKKGDLAGIRVHKFHINRQLTLLAYTYQETADVLTLLALGSHENFYTRIASEFL
jgi:mRNA-degrading endonuclease YafQ of YafQ-DinJ toxin-antitoxin module